MPSAEHTDPRAGPDEPRSPPNHVLNVSGVAIADQVERQRVACSVLVQVTMSGRRQRADTDQQSPLEPRPEVGGVLTDENRRCGPTFTDTRQAVNWSLIPHGSCYLLNRCSPILPQAEAIDVEICGFSNLHRL